MTFQLDASTRLVAAKADESKARAYLGSFGLKPGRLRDNEDGFITFEIESAAEAAAILAQKLGKRPQVVKGPGRKSWQFEAAPGKLIKVTWGRSGQLVSLVQE